MGEHTSATFSGAVKNHWRVAVLFLFVVGTFAWVLVVAPIPQDLAYHLFSDSRAFFGIPNFLNVVSNLPFLLVGLVGVGVATRECPASTRTAWVLFFVAIAFVGVGSAYYHWSPGSQSLVWDRLPMAAGFMALFAVLIGEYFDRRLVRWLLWPAVILGASSVIYWRVTDDLRLYAWVQFTPLGIVALFLLLFPSRFEHRRPLAVALGFYIVAKVFEHFDGVVFQLLVGTVSGHTLKHFCAAAGCFAVLLLQRILH